MPGGGIGVVHCGEHCTHLGAMRTSRIDQMFLTDCDEMSHLSLDHPKDPKVEKVSKVDMALNRGNPLDLYFRT